MAAASKERPRIRSWLPSAKAMSTFYLALAEGPGNTFGPRAILESASLPNKCIISLLICLLALQIYIGIERAFRLCPEPHGLPALPQSVPGGAPSGRLRSREAGRRGPQPESRGSGAQARPGYFPV